MARQRDRSQSGFTMVELLITMLILAISLAGLTALQLNTIRQVTIAQRSSEATRLAQATLDRYRALNYATLKGMESSDWVIAKNPAQADLFQVSVDGKGSGPYTVQQLVEDRSGGLKQRYLITVRVSWLDIMPGTDPDPTRRYRVQNVMISTHRIEG